MAAFKSTLEELEDADLLIHLVDISNPRFEQQIEAVETILKELKIEGKPKMLVFNKADLVAADTAENIAARYDSVSISALDQNTLRPCSAK